MLKLEKLKGEIVKLENEKTLAMHTKEQLENFFKKENKQKRFSIMFNVPNAGMSFQLILRKDLNKEYILENLAIELSRVSDEIASYQEKIEKKNKKYIETRADFVQLEKYIIDEDLYNKYIKIRSAKSLIQENVQRIGELTLNKENAKKK